MCLCAITEAVRRNHAKAKASGAEIELQIKEWLKFAKERDGGRRQRDHRRRASAPPSPAETDSLIESQSDRLELPSLGSHRLHFDLEL